MRAKATVDDTIRNPRPTTNKKDKIKERLNLLTLYPILNIVHRYRYITLAGTGRHMMCRADADVY